MGTAPFLTSESRAVCHEKRTVESQPKIGSTFEFSHLTVRGSDGYPDPQFAPLAMWYKLQSLVTFATIDAVDTIGNKLSAFLVTVTLIPGNLLLSFR
ncbi:hypothetical protein OGAPHI_000812 [Ogataea philodendri]|uniref:Uncharacterized protein n=1 Tax=Ogataea philodendri TaxID=1378263 RepID=A0A9P8T9Q3_9ASCO|nr:uncharacterized protein OGAPHI_000812 [Ogataea philodendri]KAH3671101.1 hypothetical protein OGAPHI_000812 [Ogataea philodendri]